MLMGGGNLMRLLGVILFQSVNEFCPPVKLLQLVSACSFSSTTADIPQIILQPYISIPSFTPSPILVWYFHMLSLQKKKLTTICVGQRLKSREIPGVRGRSRRANGPLR
jgi:hypothetical protein